MHFNVELMIAAFCIVFGAGMQLKARKAGAADMQVLGAMIWAVGLVLLMDCQWHFLTEPEH